MKYARQSGVLAGIDLENFPVGTENDLLVAVTEKRTRADLDGFAAALREETCS